MQDHPTYARRFRDKAAEAYGLDRSNSDEKICIKLFITSLHDRDMAKEIFSAKPRSLDDAIDTAIDLHNLDLKMSSAFRGREVRSQ